MIDEDDQSEFECWLYRRAETVLHVVALTHVAAALYLQHVEASPYLQLAAVIVTLWCWACMAVIYFSAVGRRSREFERTQRARAHLAKEVHRG